MKYSSILITLCSVLFPYYRRMQLTFDFAHLQSRDGGGGAAQVPGDAVRAVRVRGAVRRRGLRADGHARLPAVGVPPLLLRAQLEALLRTLGRSVQLCTYRLIHACLVGIHFVDFKAILLGCGLVAQLQ